jgi:hypothetical protein
VSTMISPPRAMEVRRAGRVRNVPERREVLVASAHHVSDELLAARDADAGLNPVPLGTSVSEGLQECPPGLDGLAPVCVRREPWDEQRHDLVAGDLSEKAPVFEQGTGSTLVEAGRDATSPSMADSPSAMEVYPRMSANSTLSGTTAPPPEPTRFTSRRCLGSCARVSSRST